MTFQLVRFGWPNVVAVIALAALPFVSLALPAEQWNIYSQTDSVEDGAQNQMIVAANTAAE